MGGEGPHHPKGVAGHILVDGVEESHLARSRVGGAGGARRKGSLVHHDDCAGVGIVKPNQDGVCLVFLARQNVSGENEFLR